MNKASERQKRYDDKNVTRFCLKLNNKSDADIIERFKKADNIQGYIKRLVRRDAGMSEFWKSVIGLTETGFEMYKLESDADGNRTARMRSAGGVWVTEIKETKKGVTIQKKDVACVYGVTDVKLLDGAVMGLANVEKGCDGGFSATAIFDYKLEPDKAKELGLVFLGERDR